MPAERVAMRQAREIICLKFSAGLKTREIARRLGLAPSTVRETLRRFESAGLSWPFPDGMRDTDLEAALYGNRGSKRGHRGHAEPDWRLRPPARQCSTGSTGCRTHLDRAALAQATMAAELAAPSA